MVRGNGKTRLSSYPMVFTNVQKVQLDNFGRSFIMELFEPERKEVMLPCLTDP